MYWWIERVRPWSSQHGQALAVIDLDILLPCHLCEFGVHGAGHPELRLGVESVGAQSGDMLLSVVHGLVEQDSRLVANVGPKHVDVVRGESGAQVERVDGSSDGNDAEMAALLRNVVRDTVEGGLQDALVDIPCDLRNRDSHAHPFGFVGRGSSHSAVH